ncbi:MAG: peptidylprolyl isomerase [Candidatus Korarchaeum sp.]|nr:peptidylprolyl isomerase [Candidatus Korarchaeum sp.]MDW8036394.1 peptidylprolyl isomerase [Candidatus Korarchaeum sp.]
MEKEFLLVNLTLKDAETRSIYQTTSEEVAKEAGIYSNRVSYTPVLVIPGESNLFPKLLERLLSSEEGEKFEIVLDPEEAYGSYDRSKVKVYSVKRLEREGIHPHVGEAVYLDDQRGVVQSVTGGRVTVDFNHPLAGKRLLVECEVLRRIRDDLEKVRAIVADTFDVKFEEISVRWLEDGVVEVILLPKAYMLRDSYSRKINVLSLVMRHLRSVKVVRFVEDFEIPRREVT